MTLLLPLWALRKVSFECDTWISLNSDEFSGGLFDDGVEHYS
jgi:hypothetical protein